MGKIAGKHGKMTAHYQKNMNKNNDGKGKRLNIIMNNLVVLQLPSDGTSGSKTNDSRKYRELW